MSRSTIERLPEDIIESIFRELTDFIDVSNLAVYLNYFPSPHETMIRIFGTKVPENAKFHHQKILTSLALSNQISESMWNYRSVYRRAEQIISLCLKQVEGGIDTEPRVESKSQRTHNNMAIASSTLKLYFTQFPKTCVLTGIGCAGQFIGCKSGCAQIVQLSAGGKLYYASCENSIVAVRDSSFSNEELGSYQTFTEINTTIGSLLTVDFDTFKITRLASVEKRAEPFNLQTWTWASKFPDFHYIPRMIFPPQGQKVWEHLSLSSVRRFHAFVTNELRLTGLAIEHTDHTWAAIGTTDRTVNMLTLSMGLELDCYPDGYDSLIGVQFARLAESCQLGVKIISKRSCLIIGQGILFSQSAVEALALVFDKRPRGGIPLASGAAILDSKIPNTVLPDSKEVQMLSDSITPEIQSGMISFEANVKETTEFIAYSLSKDDSTISGLTLAYRSQPPVVLGQARYDLCKRRKNADDQIGRIDVHYLKHFGGETVSRICFYLTSGTTVELGDTPGEWVEQIVVSKADAILIFRSSPSHSEISIK